MCGAVLHRDGAKDHGVAVLNETRTLRELGHAADLERECASSELALHPLNHVFYSLRFGRGLPDLGLNAEVMCCPEERATAARGHACTRAERVA